MLKGDNELLNRLLEMFIIFFILFTFLFVFFRVPFRKNRRIQSWGIPCVLSAIILFSRFNKNFIGRREWIIFIYMLFSTVLIFFIFELKVSEVLINAFSIYLLEAFFEMAIAVNIVHEASVDRLQGSIIMLSISLFIWFWYLLIGRKIDSDFLRIPLKLWIVLDIILFILILMMAFFTEQILDVVSDESKKKLGVRLSSIGALAIVILLFILIYYYNKMNKIKMKEMVIEVRIEQQKNYFEQLLDKEKETKIFRHEVINHFLEMRNFCNKKRYDQLLAYLDREIGIVGSIAESIYDIGNETVNTVINYYLAPIKSAYDIVVIGKMDDCCSVEDRDLCVLFANLIKNAVEAVNKTDKGYIKVEINNGENFLRAIVENSYSGNIQVDKDGNPITSKEDSDNHGIGIFSIKEIIKRYSGEYIVNTENGVFMTEVILNI